MPQIKSPGLRRPSIYQSGVLVVGPPMITAEFEKKYSGPQPVPDVEFEGLPSPNNTGNDPKRVNAAPFSNQFSRAPRRRVASKPKSPGICDALKCNDGPRAADRCLSHVPGPIGAAASS